MEKSPTQPDLFDDEPVRTPSPIVAIENAIKEYRALLMLTAADYTYIMKNFDIPTEVTQSYIAYLRNLILIGDSVGTVKLYLDLWVKQSIAL
jgi:hypothetical protein